MNTGGASGHGGSGSTPVTLTVYRQGFGPANAEFVAFQDGDGAWTQVSGSSGVYQGAAQGARYGFVVVCINTGLVVRIQNFQMTVSETSTLTHGCPAASALAHKVSGTLSGIVSGQAANIGIGPTALSVFGTTYSLAANSGAYDFVAARTQANAADKATIERSVAVNADITRNVDFGTQGFALEPHTLTLTNVDVGGSSTAVSSIITKLGTQVSLGGSATQWVSLPVAQIQTNDVHLIKVTSSKNSQFRNVSHYLTTPSDLAIDLPVNLSGGSAKTYVSAPAPLVEFTWDAYASVNVYSFSAVAGIILWAARVSPGWLGASATYTYRQPDLTNVAGWNATWNSVVHSNIAWVVSADTSSRGLSGALFQNNVVPPTTGLNGLEQRSAQQGGAFTAP